MIIYTDKVIKNIGKFIASYEPEKGGALLGIPNSNLITDFIEDPLAEVSNSSYFPSKGLTLKVNELELRHGLQFKGIIHSHPGNFDAPSIQDGNAFTLGLSINPSLSGFVAPIITVTKKHDEYDDNELKLNPRGQLATYVAYREKKIQQEPDRQNFFYRNVNEYTNKYSSSGVTIEKTPCAIMPIAAHSHALKDKLQAVIGLAIGHSEGYLEVNDVLFISERYIFNTAEVIILFHPNYPTTKPFVLVSKITNEVKADTKEVSFPWSLSYSEGTQLTDMCADAIISFIGAQDNTWIGYSPSALLGSKAALTDEAISAKYIKPKLIDPRNYRRNTNVK